MPPLTMTLRLLRWWRGMRGSSVCRKAMPRAISKANFTACIWSTTKSGKGVTGGQPTLSPPQGCGWRDPCCPQKYHPPALTGPLVQDVVQGAIGHPVADDDGVRSWRGLAGAQHRQHVGVGKDPARQVTALRTGRGCLHPLACPLPSPRASQPLATALEHSWPHRAGRLLPAPHPESCRCPKKVPGWPGPDAGRDPRHMPGWLQAGAALTAVLGTPR